jgi:flagellar biosynthetic protein FlhB
MADDEEKTEEPTGKKLAEAREQGNVPKSQDLTSGVMLLLAVLALYIFGERTWNLLVMDTIRVWSMIPHFKLTDQSMIDLGRWQLVHMLLIMYPILLLFMIAGVLVNLGQVGFLWSWKLITPNLKTVFGMQGLKNMVSMNAWMELLKGIAKIIIVGVFAYIIIKSHYEELIVLPQASPMSIALTTWRLSFELMLYCALLLVVLGVLDFFYQKFRNRKQLRMSKQDVKDEWKQMEGDPKVKQRIRQNMMQMSQKFMMKEVPQATVVITNPTFIAIALRYEPGQDEAPVVLAKGKRLIAQKIREIAQENQIPIVENKPLARGMIDLIQVGEPIPADYFTAVAEVLAFVFSSKEKRRV